MKNTQKFDERIYRMLEASAKYAEERQRTSTISLSVVRTFLTWVLLWLSAVSVTPESTTIQNGLEKTDI